MFKKKKFIISLFFAYLFAALPLFAGGTTEETILPNSEKTIINIAAAGNLSEIIPVLNSLYHETHPGVELNVSIASTGKLTTQIMTGAPFDIMLGANTTYPAKLAEEGFAAEAPVVYAYGEIILFSRHGSGFSKGLEDLCDGETFRHVVIANPKLAPYGRAAVSALECCGIELTAGRRVTAETIKQAATMAVTAADAGILAKSTIICNPELNEEGVFWTAIPAENYTPIEQAMVMIKNSAWKQQPEELKAYRDFILSDEAAVLFKQYGYSTPSGKTGR